MEPGEPDANASPWHRMTYRDSVTALLAVLDGAGLRRGEVSRLEVDDFDPAEDSLRIRGKSRRERTVYLSPGACEHVGEPGSQTSPKTHQRVSLTTS